ncbi:MAG: DNA polymerase II large subunit [Candidatus Bathyarchaeia archaeon]
MLSEVPMSASYRKYVQTLEQELMRVYEVAKEARSKGFDPSLKPETEIAEDMAALVEGLVGPKGVAERIRELISELPREGVAFKIAEEIIYGKFGHFEAELAAEQALRTALAILTEGLTAAPVQGIAKVKIKSNMDGSKYLAIYFAGPIRSAGGTDQALTLVIGDFIRKLLGLDRYKPTEEEISRFIEEIRLYERSVSRFQYHVSDEELRKALQWLPVEVTGTETDPVEVSSYRNLPRIETNRVRGGALRVVNDGIVGRASKVLAIVEKLGIKGWEWLKDIRKMSEKKSASFMEDVVAGRPIFSFPSKKGGFRLRYGRSRNTGLTAVGIHPATMLVLQGFIAAGTQLRLELPGKGGVALPVDYIEPPIVKLKNGSVVKVSIDNFNLIKDDIEQILFLGDILVSFGDFLYQGRSLSPSGYVEEWWVQDLGRKISVSFGGNLKRVAEITGIPEDRLRELLSDPYINKPNWAEALSLAKNLGIPLHPAFTFFWTNLEGVEEFKDLRKWLFNSELIIADKNVIKIIGNLDDNVKRSLEKICVPHRLDRNKIVIDGDNASAFAFCLGYECKEADLSATNVLDAIRIITGVLVKDKAPTFVGARMGRPEKAKRREMAPLVHVLFPTGLAGGFKRDIVEASKKGTVYVDIVRRKCPSCGCVTISIKCPSCNSDTVIEKNCPRCGKTFTNNVCPLCKRPGIPYERRAVNIRELLERACNRLGVSIPKILKGVKGLTNESKVPEILEKGILRVKYDLSVYKDGTIRFDATNAPLTHFKPREIGVSIEKLKSLGYTHDIYGKPLEDSEQICELKIQDVVIPIKCAEYFVRVSNFVDELLVKVYNLQPYYNVKSIHDLVGHLIVGLAPHTSVGVLGRIIGFTNLNLCYAHPIWHSAKRRDCDGDEDALMLALDMFLNFSREYLPAQIGGIMDAPLLLIPIVNPKEVQRQAHDLDVGKGYPLEFYEKAAEMEEAKRMSQIIDLVEHRLGTEAQFEGYCFTTPVSDINAANPETAYKKFRTMIDKLRGQLTLAEKIQAVEARKVALKVLTTHFLRDITGNLRAFATQGFRCKSCNKRFRRPPLKGNCPFCGGQLSLTVHKGNIEKYLNAAEQIIKAYNLPKYYAQRISLVKDELVSLFEGKKSRQVTLTDFA